MHDRIHVMEPRSDIALGRDSSLGVGLSMGKGTDMNLGLDPGMGMDTSTGIDMGMDISMGINVGMDSYISYWHRHDLRQERNRKVLTPCLKLGEGQQSCS